MEAFGQVRDLLVSEFGIKSSKIKPESRIREDLGICGDDGIDLFTALEEQYGVDLSEYRHDEHFEPERVNFRTMFTKAWWKYQPQLTITVADLVDAVKSGKWHYKNDSNHRIQLVGGSAPEH